MTTTMLLCLLNSAWGGAGKTNAVHLFQQYDDDYDALRLVEYCIEKTYGETKSFQDDDDCDALMIVEYCLGKNKRKE